MNRKPTYFYQRLALLAALIVSTLPQLAFAQADKGGRGGSGDEVDLKHFIHKLIPYLESKDGKKLFPEMVAYDLKHPDEPIIKIASELNPSVVDHALFDQNHKPRDCVGYLEPVRYFECDGSRLPAMPSDLAEQTVKSMYYGRLYRLVLHEILVQAKLEDEVVYRVASDYPLASRLDVHLELYPEWEPGPAAAVISSGPCLNLNDFASEQGLNYMTTDIEIVPDGKTVTGSFKTSVLHNTEILDHQKGWSSSSKGMEVKQTACESVKFGDNLELKIVAYTPTHLKLNVGWEFDLLSNGQLQITSDVPYTTPIRCPLASSNDPNRGIQEDHLVHFVRVAVRSDVDLNYVTVSRALLQFVGDAAKSGGTPWNDERIKVCHDFGKPMDGNWQYFPKE